MRLGYSLSSEEHDPRALVAQAAATSALLLEGRFALGVGSGEALNEHILGDAWPQADVRLEMLEEAIEVMRLLSKSTDLAARVADGFITTKPDAELIGRYRDAGGRGAVQAGAKVCFGPDEAAARATVHRLWPNMGLPGELAQILPTPAHFEQAAEIVDEDTAVGSVPCGPDLDAHAESLQAFADAGVDELFLHQIGPDHDGFFETWAPAMLERFGA